MVNIVAEFFPIGTILEHLLGYASLKYAWEVLLLPNTLNVIAMLVKVCFYLKIKVNAKSVYIFLTRKH